jgi:uncharacterized protein (TIGR00255 family)
MIKSMTGYGVAEQDLPLGRVAIEVRSLNHKYLDISLKLPRGFSILEAQVREQVKKAVSRGRVDLVMRIDSSASVLPRYRLEADMRLAEEYIRVLDEIKERFGLKGEVNLDHIAAVREIVPFFEVKEEAELYGREISAVMEQALCALEASRRQEGEALEADLQKRLQEVRGLLGEIKEKAPVVVIAYRERLRERVRLLLEGSDFDERRFQQEVAYFAERSDVSEEIVRMESHLHQFTAKLAEEGPAGRGLDFILQEMNREVNTIGAKATDVDISQRVIALKGELERMREQVQNIE